LLNKTGAREQALTREAGQTQTQTLTGELTARLREVSEAIGDLQVTRKTLISPAGHDDDQAAAAEPAGPSPATCAWPWTWTCRSCPRIPRTSGQS
jgi:hypothetical protein